ncbi:hypothetical protein M422DRAFT_38137 [Sphaerobolus stellatus SS14]|uniref:Uncharacterized protein n=1 Tax=Sphaerobolus stellatus (strain SS14) TaxID=990650 RepID=A0A0C9UMB9_SPHS4|nr:hypothetical protein M422DRAFT_38137 [Sphaerobolus stellatus SS14]
MYEDSSVGSPSSLQCTLFIYGVIPSPLPSGHHFQAKLLILVYLRYITDMAVNTVPRNQ